MDFETVLLESPSTVGTRDQDVLLKVIVGLLIVLSDLLGIESACFGLVGDDVHSLGGLGHGPSLVGRFQHLFLLVLADALSRVNGQTARAVLSAADVTRQGRGSPSSSFARRLSVHLYLLNCNIEYSILLMSVIQ